MRPAYVAYAGCDIQYHGAPPPTDLVSRLHLVARTHEGLVVVCRSVQGWRFLPGGTREPDEPLPHLAARELAEEAGAELRSEIRLFGGHEAISRLPAPYRPRLPQPRTSWAYAGAQGEVSGPPTTRGAGEQVVAFTALPPHEAVAALAKHDALHAGLLAEAIDCGLV